MQHLYNSPERLFREETGILRDARVVGKGLQYGDQVAYGNLFPQQPLQDLLDLAEREVLLRVVDDGGIILAQGVEHALDLLAPQDFRGVALDYLGQVRGDDARRVHDGVAGAFGLVADVSDIHSAGRPKAGSLVFSPLISSVTPPGLMAR